LPSENFQRVHKSFIVHCTKIERIVSNRIYLTNDTKVPIGRAYKEDFMRRFIE
ncbi:MAG: LytTR family transcriptional regulator DNA-binding domain-containing protein, partial [Bacteroidota bacterium]